MKKEREESGRAGWSDRREQMSESVEVVKVMPRPSRNSRSLLSGRVQGEWLSARMCACVYINVPVRAPLKGPEQVPAGWRRADEARE